MFHAHILGWNHFAVEHNPFGAVLFVVTFNQAQYILHKFSITWIVIDLDTERLGCLDQTVYTDGEVLSIHVDITGIE